MHLQYCHPNSWFAFHIFYYSVMLSFYNWMIFVYFQFIYTFNLTQTIEHSICLATSGKPHNWNGIYYVYLIYAKQTMHFISNLMNRIIFEDITNYRLLFYYRQFVSACLGWILDFLCITYGTTRVYLEHSLHACSLVWVSFR